MFELREQDPYLSSHQVVVPDEFLHTEPEPTIGGFMKYTQKSLGEILTDADCPAMDLVIAKFRHTFGDMYTKQDMIDDPTAHLHIAYYGFMQYMTGTLRVENSIHGQEVGQYLFDLFVQARKRYQQEVPDEADHNFMGRLLPLVKAKLGILSDEEAEQLDHMYILVRDLFKNKYRNMTSFRGEPITYVTHLKEVFLTLLFTGQDITVNDLLKALGHDLKEDISKEDIAKAPQETRNKIGDRTIKQYLQDEFPPAVVFGILQLSKQSVEEKMNRNIEFEYQYTLEDADEDDHQDASGYDFDISDSIKKKELIAGFIRYRQLKKRGEIQEIPEQYAAVQEEYYTLKEEIREEYFQRMFALSEMPFLQESDELYFDTMTLEMCDDNMPSTSMPFSSISFRSLIMVKASDVVNNLATLYDEPGDKVIRKIIEAKRRRLLINKYAPEFLPIIDYWIGFWEANMQLDLER